MSAPAITIATAGHLSLWIEVLLNAWIIAGIAAWILATLLWIVALNRAPLSYVYLLSSLNFIVVPLASRWLFDETLTRLQLAGMVVIAAGVLLTLAGRMAGIDVE